MCGPDGCHHMWLSLQFHDCIRCCCVSILTFDHLTPKAYRCCMKLRYSPCLKFVWVQYVNVVTLTFHLLTMKVLMWRYLMDITLSEALKTLCPAVRQVVCLNFKCWWLYNSVTSYCTVAVHILHIKFELSVSFLSWVISPNGTHRGSEISLPRDLVIILTFLLLL